MTLPILFEGLWCTAGWIFLSYQGAAQEKGWPIGNIYRSTNTLIFGFSGILLPFIGAFFIPPWWASFLIVGLGFLLMSLILGVFKSRSQIIAPVFIFIAAIIFLIEFL